MDLTHAVLTRRSAIRLSAPAPSDTELEELLQAAMTAPDHGRLSPWRLVTIRGDARNQLGEAMADAAGDDATRERTAAKALRAPLLVAVVFCPRDHPKVPRWEQLAATACAMQTLLLLLHDSGWGAIWRTGTLIDTPQVRELHGISDSEQLLGWLYVGTTQTPRTPAPRPPQNPAEKITQLPTPDAVPVPVSALARSWTTISSLPLVVEQS
ncbi:nitroreductase family protein [Streptacidiphilus fuscans]|uniref:Putative NAD(P)H nitroreductase n=1 Tax=Streptacidiphilus fuscans TaxID=2789292 RepID=A0A931AX35_9ACTN|nr:nitroreductase [Streptacidiphilus fuscans]MBF9067120.1 nitroreductase [Streptacidiphilus fuscans]